MKMLMIRDSETTIIIIIIIIFANLRGGGGQRGKSSKMLFFFVCGKTPRQYNFESANFIVEKFCCHYAGS